MPAELDVAIRIEHVSSFVLDVKLTVQPGITILFGPSGSGKSTLLFAIAGMVKPHQGTIRFGDELWFDSTKRMAAPVRVRQIGLVFQSLALFPHMTALKNVEYGMHGKYPKAEREGRALEHLRRMRVEHLAHRKPQTFSGGEAQRVALARTLAMSPRMLLLDEPFSALDHALRTELAEDVKSIVAQLGLPTLFVTHHRNEARVLADRVLLIEHGKITKNGGAELISGGPHSDEA